MFVGVTLRKSDDEKKRKKRLFVKPVRPTRITLGGGANCPISDCETVSPLPSSLAPGGDRNRRVTGNTSRDFVDFETGVFFFFLQAFQTYIYILVNKCIVYC